MFLGPGLLLLWSRAVTQAGGTHVYGHFSFQRRKILAQIVVFHLGESRSISARRVSSSFNLSQIVLFYLRGEVTVLRGSDSHHAPSRDECTAPMPLPHQPCPSPCDTPCLESHPSHPPPSPSSSSSSFPCPQHSSVQDTFFSFLYFSMSYLLTSHTATRSPHPSLTPSYLPTSPSLYPSPPAPLSSPLPFAPIPLNKETILCDADNLGYRGKQSNARMIDRLEALSRARVVTRLIAGVVSSPSLATNT